MTTAMTLAPQEEPLVTRSGEVPISLRIEREPGGGLLYVHADDATSFVELLRTMAAPSHVEVITADTQAVVLTYVGMPGAPPAPDPTWYDMYVTEMGWVALVDPATAQDYDVAVYLTDDPNFIASNAGPQGDLAVLATDGLTSSIYQARLILAGSPGVTPPISPTPLPEPDGPPSLLELRPELKEMAKTYRSIEPATASVGLSPWAWAIGAAVLSVGFYVFYWEPKYRSAY
jgi:hypothetical protein